MLYILLRLVVTVDTVLSLYAYPLHILMRINYTDKEDKTHYLGVPMMDDESQLIMNYSYRYNTLISHLTASYPLKLQENVDIMYLIKDRSDVYCVVLKTFWLRIVQRKWKKILKERKEKQRQRCNPNVQYAHMISRNRDIHLSSKIYNF